MDAMGESKKSVLTGTSKIEPSMRRDSKGRFDPQLIAKYQRPFPDFDEKIISIARHQDSWDCLWQALKITAKCQHTPTSCLQVGCPFFYHQFPAVSIKGIAIFLFWFQTACAIIMMVSLLFIYGGHRGSATRSQSSSK